MTRIREIVVGGNPVHRKSKRGRKLRNILMAVVALSYVLWAMEAMTNDTRIKQALVDISRIEHAARLFRADHGRCPKSVEELAAPPKGGPYLRKTKDPWGQPYRLACPARSDPGGVEVISGGPDASLSGEDGVSSL